MELNEPSIMPPYSPSRKPPLFPLLFGFLTVVVVAASFGVAYYKSNLLTTPSSSPSLPPATQSPSLEPSPSLLATESALLTASPRPSLTPVSAIPSLSPQPTPPPVASTGPSLDLRFGNPSAYVKQTIDEGQGDGRVINREYSSLQVGSFDEVRVSWSPKITACFNLVSNETVKGNLLKFRLTLNNQLQLEGDLGQYNQLEAGKIYVWCHDLQVDLGQYTARLELNPGKTLREWNFNNNLARIDYENIADNIAPNFTLIGPHNEGESGTCLYPQNISDNVTPVSNLKLEHKIDTQNWTQYDGEKYCFLGDSGSPHTYSIRLFDARGNRNEQSRSFNLF